MADMEAGFLIGEERYAVPTLDTITLDEERILYVYADTVLQDFGLPHPEAPEDEKQRVERAQLAKVRNPDFKRALAHIAYKRAHPDLTDTDIQKAIGEVRALELDNALIRGDDRPPALSSQKPPDDETSTSAPSKASASGSPTGNGSGKAAETQAPTGTGG